jgi:CysZ protein
MARPCWRRSPAAADYPRRAQRCRRPLIIIKLRDVDSRQVRRTAARAASPGKEFFAGLRLLGRGLGMYGRSPKLLALGLLPALLSFLVLATALGTLFYFLSDVAAAVTWFADGWAEGPRSTLRLLAAIAVAGVSVFLSIMFYTALTLTIGDPFYEKISEMVEARFGDGQPTQNLPWWRELRRSIGDGIRITAKSALIGIPLFAAGFIPVVGQTVVPVVGGLVGGWFLAVELTGVAFARRGMGMVQRRALLRQHRSLALGFGVGVLVCFLIPLGAVLVMPAAVAGGTLLSRRVLGLSQ